MKKFVLFASLFLAPLGIFATPNGDDGTGAVCPGFDWDEEIEEFEIASKAVSNMRLGWNLGNSLDANSGDTQNMWIELWTGRKPSDYETAWGQPVTTRALIHMMKEAGYNVIRVPVTWYPHMGKVTVTSQTAGGNTKGIWDMQSWEGTTVDSVWMARVHEVVDYVVQEGMYCILNVHHDTGEASTAWVRADKTKYQQYKSRFESLWKQIATEFRDYDEHLLFEGYNEMLDKYGSWCFAANSATGGYNVTDANNAYEAVNMYAQSFVNAVRSTGGNNITRNLVLCTYGACCGDGNWSTHLTDPLSKMALPADSLSKHLIFEVHAYPSFNNLTEAKQSVDRIFSNLETHLLPKAPVIIGEWGTLNSNVTYSKAPQLLCDFAWYFCNRARQKGFAPIYWMGLSDGDSRSVPEFNEPWLRDAQIKGFAGEELGIESLGSGLSHPQAVKRMVGNTFYIQLGDTRFDALGNEVR